MERSDTIDHQRRIRPALAYNQRAVERAGGIQDARRPASAPFFFFGWGGGGGDGMFMAQGWETQPLKWNRVISCCCLGVWLHIIQGAYLLGLCLRAC